MILAIVCIILLCLFIKLLRIKFLSPEGLFSFMWIAMILGGIFFLSKKYRFTYLGVYWILFSVFCFCIFSKLGYWIYNKNNDVAFHTPLKAKEIPNIPWKMNIIFIGFSLMSLLYVMIQNEVSFNSFENLSTLQTVSHALSVKRYSGEETTSLIGQVLNSFNYVSPLCCGYSYIFASSKKEKLICISCIIPVLLSMFLTSAKSGFISFVILFFIGFFISYIYIYSEIPRIRFRYILIGIVGGIIALFLFYFSFYLRIGKTDSNVYDVISDKLMIYAFGHIQGFDIWFSNNRMSLSDLGLGSNTFLAISSRLGFAEKVLGVYRFEAGTCTNVYSYFRGLIEDYGALFSLVIIIMLSVISSYNCNKIKYSNRKNVLNQWILSIILFSMFYVYISPWIYTSYYFAFILFGLFLYWTFNIKIRFIWRKNVH